MNNVRIFNKKNYEKRNIFKAIFKRAGIFGK